MAISAGRAGVVPLDGAPTAMAAPDARAPREPAIWQQSRDSGGDSGGHFALVAGSIDSVVAPVVSSGCVGGTCASADDADAVALAVAGAGVGDVGSMGARLAHELMARATDEEAAKVAQVAMAKAGLRPGRPRKNGSFLASDPRRIRRR